MMVEQPLATEILEQLKADILYFGWMVQIARLQNPDRAEDNNHYAVVHCVAELQNQGRIVVGHARESGGVVLIEPWPETGRHLLNRMTMAIQTTVGHDRSFCFWIQLVEHFAK